MLAATSKCGCRRQDSKLEKKTLKSETIPFVNGWIRAETEGSHFLAAGSSEAQIKIVYVQYLTKVIEISVDFSKGVTVAGSIRSIRSI